MAVHPITEARFSALFTLWQPMPYAQERAWFETDDGGTIGAVVFDRPDKDWTYVVLERDDDNAFRWIEGNSCIETQEKATTDLMKAMTARESTRK